MYAHLTASGSTGSNIAQGHIRKAIIQYNNTVSSVVTTVSDETGTAGTPVVATITSPTVGQIYEFWDLKNGLTVQSTLNVDMTVSVSGGQGGNQ